MKNLARILFILFSFIFIFYLLLPNPDFPDPPADALQSNEPGDTESDLRRAYFTNYTREEVMEHYKNQFEEPLFLGIFIPSYRLNYPPEEAQTIIRDQTRSTFLEEIVHPFRESVFINGFEPTAKKDAILIGDKEWLQKITVRFIPSSKLPRVLVATATLLLIVMIEREWVSALSDLFLKRKK
ncbi:MAG: hypothetical protein P8Y17_01005 [Patescibacteria group bacterium]